MLFKIDIYIKRRDLNCTDRYWDIFLTDPAPVDGAHEVAEGAAQPRHDGEGGQPDGVVLWTVNISFFEPAFEDGQIENMTLNLFLS